MKDITFSEIVDMPQDDFVEFVSPLNVTEVNAFILLMSQAYTQLCGAKDKILQRDNISDDKKEETVKQIYAELLKIEAKVTHLKKRFKELTPSVFDTENN